LLDKTDGPERDDAPSGAVHAEAMDFLASLQNLIGQDERHILWWQMSIRALIVFVFGLVLIRLFGRRVFGRQNPLDIVIAIVIGSNLSRTLTGNSKFLPTLAATITLVLIFWLSDHLAARWPFFSRLTKGLPVKLARGGELDQERMRRHAVSKGDVEEAARTSGLCGVDDLEGAVLERNGKISAIKRKGG
jgi:uncharacterized membrane protein YcaP (DUF421 family)